MISWGKAYALFALPSFVQHKAYLTRRLDSRSREQVARYSYKGWKAQDILWPEEAIARRPIQQQRRVGYRFTWIIDLPTHDITSEPTTPDFVLEYSQFQLYEEEDAVTGLRFYAVQAEPFTAPVLKYQYTHGVREKRFVESVGLAGVIISLSGFLG